jgi:hypothetical protein
MSINTAERIYQESQILPENLRIEVLDFIGYLKTRYAITANNIKTQPLVLAPSEMNEFDQFGAVYDGHFDRDACYDR